MKSVCFVLDYCLINTRGPFLCINPLYILIDTTELYIPIVLIIFAENKFGIE